MTMKYEWVITGREFFLQSGSQVRMLRAGMRSPPSQNNVAHRSEQKMKEDARGGFWKIRKGRKRTRAAGGDCPRRRSR